MTAIFNVRYRDGSKWTRTTITIHEKHIECPMTPNITFDELEQILMNNSEKEKYRERSFGLKVGGNVFNFLAKNSKEREEISKQIFDRNPYRDQRLNRMADSKCDETQSEIIKVMAKERQELKEEIRRLEKYQKDLDRERIEFETRMEEAFKQNQGAMESERAALRQSIAEFEAKKKDFRLELQTKVGQYQQDRAQLNCELEECEQKKEALAQKHDEMKADFEKLKGERNDIKNQRQILMTASNRVQNEQHWLNALAVEIENQKEDGNHNVKEECIPQCNCSGNCCDYLMQKEVELKERESDIKQKIDEHERWMEAAQRMSQKITAQKHKLRKDTEQFEKKKEDFARNMADKIEDESAKDYEAELKKAKERRNYMKMQLAALRETVRKTQEAMKRKDTKAMLAQMEITILKSEVMKKSVLQRELSERVQGDTKRDKTDRVHGEKVKKNTPRNTTRNKATVPRLI